MKRIKLPDGQFLEFPDETPTDVMFSAARRDYPQHFQDQPAANEPIPMWDEQNPDPGPPNATLNNIMGLFDTPNKMPPAGMDEFASGYIPPALPMPKTRLNEPLVGPEIPSAPLGASLNSMLNYFRDVPENISSANAYRAGADFDVFNQPPSIAESEKLNQQRIDDWKAKGLDPRMKMFGLEDMSLGGFQEGSQSSGFSALSSGAGLVTGAATAALPIPGARPAAFVAGAGASGKVAYDIAVGMFKKSAFDAYNDESNATNKRDMNPKEWEERWQAVYPLAVKTGLFEAGPEALSNLVMGGVLFAPLKKLLGKSIMTRLPSKIAAVLGTELATETVTEVGQQQAGFEAKIPGHEDLSFTKPEDILKAFEAIKEPTLAMTAMQGGSVGLATKAGTEVKRTAKGEGAPFTAKRKVSNAIIEELEKSGAPEAQEVVEVFRRGMAEKGGIPPQRAEKPAPAGPAPQTQAPPKAETAAEKPAYSPPLGKRAHQYLDPILKERGYDTIADAPQEERAEIAYKAERTLNDEVQGRLEGRVADETQDPNLVAELTDAAFELRRVIDEGSAGEERQQPRQQRQEPRGKGGTTVQLTGSKEDATKSLSAAVTVVKRNTDTLVASFDKDIPEYGVKAGDRVTIDRKTGDLKSGFGTGPYAAARTGKADIQVGHERRKKPRFSKIINAVDRFDKRRKKQVEKKDKVRSDESARITENLQRGRYRLLYELADEEARKEYPNDAEARRRYYKEIVDDGEKYISETPLDDLSKARDSWGGAVERGDEEFEKQQREKLENDIDDDDHKPPKFSKRKDIVTYTPKERARRKKLEDDLRALDKTDEGLEVPAAGQGALFEDGDFDEQYMGLDAEGQDEVDNAWYSATVDVESGLATPREAAADLAYNTGLPEADWLIQIGDEFPDIELDDLISEGRQPSAAEEAAYDYYPEDATTPASGQSWMDDFYEDYDKANAEYSTRASVTYVKYTPETASWGLDRSLNKDAEGEVTEGGPKMLSGHIADRIRGDALTDEPDMHKRLNRKQQKVMARVIKKMIEVGFPENVIRSIRGYGLQRESKFIGVSGAYDGKRHEIRFADYVFRDMQTYRTVQAFQKALRFLTTHELTHAIESDVNEHTLSMDSPLFAFPESALIRTETKKKSKRWDAESQKMVPYEFSTFELEINYDALGPVIAEMIKVWDANTPISTILSYPFGSIGSVPGGKTRKSRRAELNRIKAESFAQLGALYYTYPELTKEHLPTGYKLFQEVTRAADKESYSKRRSALRVTLQYESAGRGAEDVRAEFESDVETGREDGREDTQIGQDGKLGRDDLVPAPVGSGYAYANIPEISTEYPAGPLLLTERVRDGLVTGDGHSENTRVQRILDRTGLTLEEFIYDVGNNWHQIRQSSHPGRNGKNRIVMVRLPKEEDREYFEKNGRFRAGDVFEADVIEIEHREDGGSHYVLITAVPFKGADINKMEMLVDRTSQQPVQSSFEHRESLSEKPTGAGRGLSGEGGGKGQKPRRRGTSKKSILLSRTVRKGVGGAVTKKRVREIISLVTKGWKGKPTIRIIETVEDIKASEPALYHDIKADPNYMAATAFYDPNKRVVYIVRQHVNSEADIFIDLHHEIRGHYSLQQSFGKDIDSFLDEVYRVYKKQIDSSDLASLYRQDGVSAAENTRLYAEEYLSRMVQPSRMAGEKAKIKGKDPLRLIDKFRNWVNNWLRSKGLNINLTKSDVRYILSRAGEETTQGTAKEYTPGVRRLAKFAKTPVFYSQLESMMLTQAPPKGTPEQYLKWIEKAKKGAEKLVVDVEPLVEKIFKAHAFDEVISKKLITEMMGEEAGIPKKFLNTFWQQTAPKTAHAQEYVAFLRNAERAATGGPIKQEELDITGLEKYLKSMKEDAADGSPTKTELTRADISIFINANKMLLVDEYAGTFNDNYLELVEDTFGPQQAEDFVGPPSPVGQQAAALAKRPIEVTDLHFEYSETAEPDDSDWDYYYQEYIDEHLEDEQDAASENINQADYLDDDAFNEAVTELAQAKADEYNEENAEAIEAEDLDERDADDYGDSARGQIDENDYIDEDAYTEAVDEARDDAATNVQSLAEEHANDVARENADEIWTDQFSGWRIEGHDNRENWRVYDNDSEEVDSDFPSVEDAIERVVEVMNEEREWYYENGSIFDVDGDHMFDAYQTPEQMPRRRVRSPGHVATKWGSYTVGSNENYRELKLIVPAKFTPDGQYEYSVHFPTKNFIVHVRLTDKYIVTFKNGERIVKKILFIEEFQADWPGNQGGMVGFRGDNVKLFDEATAARDELVELTNTKAHRFIGEITEEQIEELKSSGMNGQRDAVMLGAMKENVENEVRLIYNGTTSRDNSLVVIKNLLDSLSLPDHQKARAENILSFPKKNKELDRTIAAHAVSVPDAPLRNSYQAVMMKRLARLAVDEGYDGISITQGADHTSRSRWGTNILTWTNIKTDAMPELMRSRVSLLEVIDNYETKIENIKLRFRTRVQVQRDAATQAREEIRSRGPAAPSEWKPTDSQLDQLIEAISQSRVDRDGEVDAFREGYFRIAENAYGVPSAAFSRHHYRHSEGQFERKIYVIWREAANGYGVFEGVDTTDIVDAQKFKEWGEKLIESGYNAPTAEDRLAESREFFDTTNTRARMDEARADIRRSREDIRIQRGRVADIDAQIENERTNPSKTLPEGQFRITSDGNIGSVVSSKYLDFGTVTLWKAGGDRTRPAMTFPAIVSKTDEGGDKATHVKPMRDIKALSMSKDYELKVGGETAGDEDTYIVEFVQATGKSAAFDFPEDRELAQKLYEKEMISGSEQVVDFNDENADDKLWNIIQEFSPGQRIQGPFGGYTTPGDTYRTLPKLKARLLKSIDDDGVAYGMWARRAAGISYGYDKVLVGKTSGFKMLGKNVKKAYIEGIVERGEYTYVEIDDEFRKTWGRAKPQFSKRRNRQGQPRRIMAKIGKGGSLAKAIEAIKTPGALLSSAKDTVIRKTLNSGLPFLRMVEQVAPDIPANEDPYYAWRLLSGDSAMIEDWLGINGKSTEGTVPYNIEDRLAKRWGQSLRSVLDPVMRDKDTLLDFIEYVTARRAKELMSVGKEKLFDAGDVAYGLSLKTPEFDRVAKALYRYQRGLLKYAVEGGLLSGESAVRMMGYTNYVPFFREAEHEGDVGAKGPKGVFKKLYGGKQNIRNPLQNIMDNTANIIHATNRNAALVKALHMAESRGNGANWMERVPMPKGVTNLPTQRIIEQLADQGVNIDMQSAGDIAMMQTFFQNKPIGDEKNRIIILKEEGKPIAVKVRDLGMWDSLHAMAPMEFGLLTDIVAFPAETLKTGIVLSPEFMTANFSRDTLSGFIQARMGTTIVPVVSSAVGMIQVVSGAEVAKLARAMGGGNADFWHGDSKEAHATLTRLARLGKYHPGTVLNPATYWRFLRRLGSITESGTRLSAFGKQLELHPDDPANAILSAIEHRDVSVDFSLHGTSKTIRVLERITPFLNPAKQGLYKMARVLGEQPITTLARGTPIVLMTFYLWMLNKDEDWYKDLEDWEKNMYWHADIGLRYMKDDDEGNKAGEVIPVRIPKPFEYGALFGSFLEALFEYINGEAGDEVMKRVWSTVEDVFLLRGNPPALSIPAELWANKSRFTERDIVPNFLQGIDPKYQYSAYTTAPARAAGEFTGWSPMKIDHVVRGVFGTLGMYTMMALDDPTAKVMNYPSKQSRHWWQQPGMRRFFSDPLRPAGKAMTEFYDDLNRKRMEQKTWKFLDFDKAYLESLTEEVERSDYKTAADFEKAKQARMGEPLAVSADDSIAQLMNTIRKANLRIRNRTDIKPDEKRDLIDANNLRLKSISRRFKEQRVKREKKLKTGTGG